MHSDPIADMLTRIRNAGRAKLANVAMPNSKSKVEIAKILQSEGLIAGYEIATDAKFPQLKVALKYDSRRNHAISHIRRISKPGLRIYRRADGIKALRSGLALQIVSTSQGMMTDRDARRRKIGGEVLCEVW